MKISSTTRARTSPYVSANQDTETKEGPKEPTESVRISGDQNDSHPVAVGLGAVLGGALGLTPVGGPVYGALTLASIHSEPESPRLRQLFALEKTAGGLTTALNFVGLFLSLKTKNPLFMVPAGVSGAVAGGLLAYNSSWKSEGLSPDYYD